MEKNKYTDNQCQMQVHDKEDFEKGYIYFRCGVNTTPLSLASFEVKLKVYPWDYHKSYQKNLPTMRQIQG